MLGFKKMIDKHTRDTTDMVLEQCINVIKSADDKYEAVRHLESIRQGMREGDNVTDK